MIRRILLAIVLVLSFSSVAFSYNWCDDDDIVVGYIIENGSGETLDDCSSNSKDSAFKGAGEPAWSSTVPGAGDGFDGDSSWSIDFDGNDDYTETADDPVFNITDNLSVVNWIYQDTLSFDSIIIGKYATDLREWAMRICPDAPATQEQLAVSFGKTSSNPGDFLGTRCTDADVFAATTWVHTAFTFDGGALLIYADGVSKAHSGGTVPSSLNNETAPLRIGEGGVGQTGKVPDGKIDEVAIFDTTILDSTDINDIMDNGLFESAVSRRIWMIS